MVSKVCHSQLSSSTLARAAHIPPWAAPVWLRVGYSLVRTAVRTRGPASTAARIPAPPAPTMTTSYRCSISIWTPSNSGNVCVERQQHVGAQHDREQHRQPEDGVQPELRRVLAGVVVDDRAHAVAAVQLGQPQQQQVPGLPERRGPALGDVVEVDPVDAAVPDQTDEEVSERQDDEDDAGE